MRLIKVMTTNCYVRKIFCDGTDHITMQAGVELYRWPCCCNASKEVTEHQMPEMIIGSTEGD